MAQRLWRRLSDINRPPVDCCWALEPQHELRTGLLLGPGRPRAGQAAGRRAPSPTWWGRGVMGGLGGERAGGEPRVLCARTALPPLPPPGRLRPGFAHSAAGKCYFAGKVSAGTARIPAAAPGPLGLFFFASPSASWGVGRPPGRGSGRGAAPPRRGLGCLAPHSPRVRSAQVGAAPPRPSLPLPARRVARAYLCGPGRSRGRHPVV